MPRLVSQARRIFGASLFGLSMGLIDEIPHNNVQGCYQFPYLTGIGCLPYQYAFELAFLFTFIGFLLAAVPVIWRRVEQ
jgi:hypothetical protein